MLVLDLFSGEGGWSRPFVDLGHEVITLDSNPDFGPTICTDVLTWDTAQMPWRPDLVLASPPCEAFSVMNIARNWTRPNEYPPNAPKSDSARLGLDLLRRTLAVIDELAPAYFVIENPMGKMRRMAELAHLERRTVTYCRLGMEYRKPTDLWGGFPPGLVLPEPCQVTASYVHIDGIERALDERGNPCHRAARRGARTGLQGVATSAKRALIPPALALLVAQATTNALTHVSPTLF